MTGPDPTDPIVPAADGSDDAADPSGPAGAAPVGATLFDTAIGRCGVAWRGDTVVAVQLPERSDDVTRHRLEAVLGSSADRDPTPPTVVAAAIRAMVDLLAGQPVDLGFVPVDLGDRSPFDRAVYDVTRSIPPGSSLTYGQVAERVGEPGGAQAVGRSLGANPCPIVVPCHRVLGAGGALTGFSAPGGVDTKRRMLLIEGCPAVAPTLFDQ
ncbi:MAG: methylated-DNA--[protein]-cysteine S-methyltransferase [Acidimicrobiales bacterium]